MLDKKTKVVELITSTILASFSFFLIKGFLHLNRTGYMSEQILMFLTIFILDEFWIVDVGTAIINVSSQLSIEGIECGDVRGGVMDIMDRGG